MNERAFRRQLDDLTLNNMGQVAVLHKVVLGDDAAPHKEDRYYKDAVESGEISKMAYFNDNAVGCIVSKREPISTAPDSSKSAKASKEAPKTDIVILALAVLEPYRRLGLGSMLIAHVIKTAEEDPKSVSIKVSIPQGNDAAKEVFKLHGFENKEAEAGKELWVKEIQHAAATA
ncbi:hypothetical protein HDV05_003877 [Chytridiales sp. JEL 0842]|nr:hypothetical protein HDV05_003877 [Chytridiales sp. JEL 0842]